MSRDETWERIYQERGACNRYPSEEIISFMLRRFAGAATNRSQIKVLELGCGAGPNLWFLCREGFDAHGIDGSPTAIKNAAQFLAREGFKHPSLVVGDFTALDRYYQPETFDVILEEGCIQHNPLDAMIAIVAQAHRLLKLGGAMYGRLVQAATDPTQDPTGDRALSKWGFAYRSTLEETQRVFAPFTPHVTIDERWYSFEERRKWLKFWHVEAVKRNG